MPDFPELPIINNPGPNRPFPELPIVTPDPPRATLREKYGSFLYLGIAGLIISAGWVGYFAYGVWATRDYWTAIYVMDDPKRPERERVEASWLIAHHPTANDRHRVEFALRKDLPPLARYVIAESLTPGVISADPKGYALQVARSPNWPDWLRVLLARPMAYAVGEGYQIPWEPLDELRGGADPALALWATYIRAVMSPGDAQASEKLRAEARSNGPSAGLAKLLDAALNLEGEARDRTLDEATDWLRTHHPGASKVWEGWTVRDGKIVPTS